MNGYEFSEMLDLIGFWCDGRRDNEIRLQYYIFEKTLVMKHEFSSFVIDSFENVSLSNIRQLLYEINKCLRNDKGFEKLYELEIKYR